MFRRFFALSLTLAFILCLSNTSSRATLITDGTEDFETLPLTGWVVTDGNKRLLTDAEGNTYGALAGSGGKTDSASQTFVLDPSLTSLEFDYAVGSKGSSADSFQVVLSNETESVVLFEQDINSSDDILVDPDFIHVSIDLTEEDLSAFWGEPATISFQIVDGDSIINSAFALDNVSIHGAAPVPEPSTFILCGLGLAAIFIYQKRQHLLSRIHF